MTGSNALTDHAFLWSAGMPRTTVR